MRANMPPGTRLATRPRLFVRLGLLCLLVATGGLLGWQRPRARTLAQSSPTPIPSPAPAAAATPTPSPVTPKLAPSVSPAAPAAPSASPAPPPPTPTASPAPTATPSPAPVTQADLINSLNQGELQEAINLLRANYIRPGDVDDRALARATLAGELDRLDHGALLLPKPGGPAPASAVEPLPDGFLSDTFADRVGYLRLGALNKDHLAALDKTLKGFTDKGLPAVILDLRGSGGSSDYELAAEVIRRFVAKGKPLFTLRKPSNNQERLFTSNADPLFTGLTILAVNGDTSGAAETVAAVIRYYDRALVVGANTPGQAVEYADLRLSGGSLLRVAVSQVVLPANLSIFPGGVKPDVPVSQPRSDELAIFRQSAEKGTMGPFVLETERLRFNEAALVSGVNPEYDAARDAQAARRRGEPPPKPPLRDPVIQRALDLATAITALDSKPSPPR